MAEEHHPFETLPQVVLLALRVDVKTILAFRPLPIDPSDHVKSYNPWLYVLFPDGNDSRDFDFAWSDLPPILLGHLK